ncbi:MAG TPA: helix-turn-helix domain-containing protein [Candidatus Acidoferrum sp.]|nr:helix-turn-helix domain-containing protein [Candidatus Acidoferrum sp.]
MSVLDKTEEPTGVVPLAEHDYARARHQLALALTDLVANPWLIADRLLIEHHAGLPISQTGDLAPACIYTTKDLEGLMVLRTDYRAAVVGPCLNLRDPSGSDVRGQLLGHAARLVQGRSHAFYLPLYAALPKDAAPAVFLEAGYKQVGTANDCYKGKGLSLMFLSAVETCPMPYLCVLTDSESGWYTRYKVGSFLGRRVKLSKAAAEAQADAWSVPVEGQFTFVLMSENDVLGLIGMSMKSPQASLTPLMSKKDGISWLVESARFVLSAASLERPTFYVTDRQPICQHLVLHEGWVQPLGQDYLTFDQSYWQATSEAVLHKRYQAHLTRREQAIDKRWRQLQGKLLLAFRALEENGRPMTTNQVAEQLKLDASQVRENLDTLGRLGMVTKNRPRVQHYTYQLRPGVAEAYGEWLASQPSDTKQP